MKTINLIVAVVIISLTFGCMKNQETKMLYQAKYIKTENNIPYFQADSILLSPFGLNLNYNKFENYYLHYFDKNLEFVKNIHNSKTVDTLYDYINKNTLVQFHKTRDKTLLSKFYTDDSIVFMAGNIRVGLTKNKFSKIFGIDYLNKDTCEIGNMEGTTKFRFCFKNDRLIQISLWSYLD